jgi:predicted esterase YcpF (UPF0227 family)
MRLYNGNRCVVRLAWTGDEVLDQQTTYLYLPKYKGVNFRTL